MTKEELERLEALCAAATPGPWRAGTVEAEGKVWAHDPTALGGPVLGEWCVFNANLHRPHTANRVFIAAAREALPALLAEVRRLTAERTRDRDALRWVAQQFCERSGETAERVCPASGDCLTEWCVSCYARAALAEEP